MLWIMLSVGSVGIRTFLELNGPKSHCTKTNCSHEKFYSYQGATWTMAIFIGSSKG